jgi:alkane 1-monooxygenase
MSFQYLFPFIVPAIFLLDILVLKYYYVPIILVFVVVPMFDQFLGTTKPNIKDNSLFYDIILYLWIPVQYLTFFIAMHTVSDIKLYLSEFVYIGISLGLVSSIGNTVSHELFHKRYVETKTLYNQILSCVSNMPLVLSFYTYFDTVHLKSHHVHVASKKDFSTPSYNQAIYGFLSICITDSVIFAYNYNKKLFIKKMVLPIILSVSILLTFGITSLLLYFFQSFVSIIIIESLNYVQHYGFKETNKHHSWSSNHCLGNYFLFQLQRHKDHHDNSTKKYQNLKYSEDDPKLPFGLPSMIVLAFLPSVYLRMMNPLVRELKK